jgi:DNA-binding response OmpR family regulator
MVTPSAKEDTASAVQAGVTNYIVKPFTLQMLKERIEQMLEDVPVATLSHACPMGPAAS